MSTPHRLALPALLLAAAAAWPARIQAQLAVTANAGTVHYEQATADQSLGLSPEFRLEHRHVAFALAGTFTGGSDGSRVAAAGPSLWLASSPIARHIQFDGQASFQYTSPRGDSSSYAGMAVGEIAFTSEGPGLALGVGGGTGTIAGAAAVNAFKARARGWFDAGPVSVALTAEPTVIAGTWYSDFSAAGSTEFGPLEGSVTLQLRQARTSGTSAGAEVEAAAHLSETLALQVTGGRYLRDPFQGLPAGTFFTVGVRYLLWQPRPSEGGDGVGESPLSEVDFAAANTLRGHLHGGGNALLRLRNVPALKKNAGMSGGGSGRGHKP